jgi:hypothetical protein
VKQQISRLRRSQGFGEMAMTTALLTVGKSRSGFPPSPRVSELMGNRFAKCAMDVGIGGKSEGKSEDNNQSLRPSGFAPAFGRAEAPFGAAFLARVNACPSGGSSPKDLQAIGHRANVRRAQGKGEGNNNNDKSRSSAFGEG